MPGRGCTEVEAGGKGCAVRKGAAVRVIGREVEADGAVSGSAGPDCEGAGERISPGRIVWPPWEPIMPGMGPAPAHWAHPCPLQQNGTSR